MEPLKFTDHFKQMLELAIRATHDMNASSLLMLVDGPVDWGRLRKLCGDTKVIVTAITESVLVDAQANDFCGFTTPHYNENSLSDRITYAILEAVANDYIPHGSRVVALYSDFDASLYDSISIINLGEHLDRLSGRDLRMLQTKVPLKTLKMVVDLALEIAQEGREGSMVGTLFVVGDTRNVLLKSKPAGFDPVRGYHRKERYIGDPKVREGVKEVAQLDGAFIIAPDGTVEAACRYLETNTTMLTVSKGLGARHWAAAAISRSTNAIAVAVSQSGGTVRIFQNGEVVLRIESRHRRPMVWRDFDSESFIEERR
ncbi:MAG: DNA integrity scanning protein DisA nucleotide-binding domain protein [Thermoguttaceae bacterium]